MKIARSVILLLLISGLFLAFAAVRAQDFEDDFEFVDIPDYGFCTDVFEEEYFDDEVPIEDPEAAEEPVLIDPSVLPEPDVLLRVADEVYFPRVGTNETFWQTQGYVNEVLEGDIIHQYYVRSGVDSDVLMSMFPADRYTRAGHLRPSVTMTSEKDYHISITVLRAEDIPEGAGGCWLRYSNVRVKGSGGESGLILFPGREAMRFMPVGNHQDLFYEPIHDLSDLDLDNNIKFDFIRLDGVTYIYADEKFLFSYDDGYNGKMSFEGGVEIYEGGNRVRCDFDNFTERYR